jgi:hypothetical protein
VAQGVGPEFKPQYHNKKINKIRKSLADMTKWRREKNQLNKIKDEIGYVTTNTDKIQRIIREYFENLYSHKLEILDGMDIFLDPYNQPKLKQKDINHLYSPITTKEIEAVKMSLLIKKSPGSDGFTDEFYQIFKEELIQILSNFSRK